jgi:Asp-tRNA(Asn)/Glu-tRNA(Gln) amidotransferase A subunit family amidase
MSRPETRSYIAATPHFASGQDSPRAFLERCLETVAALEPDVLAFVETAFDRARAEADAAGERWVAGKQLSPIDGMPLGVKDVIETADMATGMGSALFTGWRSGRDSASVKALREAGVLIVGKTVTTEFAASVPGPTRNPWDLTRTPGGSSSGSAAGVASGFISAGLGTQVVGSIVRPASFCGVVGVKPSLGGINRGGSHDFMSQSCQGVLAASLADAWQVLTEIATRAGGDPGYPGFVGPALPPPARAPRRLAFLETTGWEVVSESLKASVAEALSRLRAAGVEIITRADNTDVEAAEKAITSALKVTRLVNAWESRWPLNIYRDQDATKLSPEMLERLKEAEAMNQGQYRRALDQRAAIRAAYAKLAPLADGIVTLSATGPAPVGLGSTGNPAFAVPGSLLGVPAISLPLLSEAGLPVGLQVMGYEQRDADLFALASAVEGIVGVIAG